jgi:hypothetical protein
VIVDPALAFDAMEDPCGSASRAAFTTVVTAVFAAILPSVDAVCDDRSSADDSGGAGDGGADDASAGDSSGSEGHGQ